MFKRVVGGNGTECYLLVLVHHLVTILELLVDFRIGPLYYLHLC